MKSKEFNLLLFCFSLLISVFFVPCLATLPQWLYPVIRKTFYLYWKMLEMGKVSAIQTIPTREAQSIFFTFGVAFLFAFLFRNKWITAFMLWIALITITNLNQYSYSAFQFLIMWFILFYVLSEHTPDQGWRWILAGIRWGAILQIGWMVLQLCHFDPVFMATDEQKYQYGNWSPVVGFLDNPDILAAWLALSAPAFMFGWWHVGLIAILAALVYLHTTTAFAAFLVAVVWYGWQWARRWSRWSSISIAISLLSVGILFVSRVDNVTHNFRPGPAGTYKIVDPRWTCWKTTEKLIKMKPVTGWGFGQYEVAFPRLSYQFFGEREHRNEAAHNEYLQLAFEAGLPALALVLAFLVSLWRVRRKVPSWAICGCLGICVEAMGMFSFHIAPLAVLGCIYFAYSEKKR